MMYKAIVSDLDGTLFGPDSRMSARTVDALRAAAGKGFKIILATGRHHSDLQRIAEDVLGIPAYRVSQNGAVGFTPGGERIIYHPMNPDVVRRLVSLPGAPDQVYVHLYKDDKWYVNRHDEVSTTHQVESGFMFEVADYAKFGDFEDCSKICFMARDADSVDFMERTVKEVTDPRLSFFWTMNTCFEAMDIRADKGRAVGEILAREGISPEETVAFGDGLNDLNMLRLAGRGVVMGNAVKGLREALPGRQVIGTSGEDAVARFLEENLL